MSFKSESGVINNLEELYQMLGTMTERERKAGYLCLSTNLDEENIVIGTTHVDYEINNLDIRRSLLQLSKVGES